MTVKLEESVLERYQNEVVAELREEFGGYFNAISKHPRLLVGTKVPSPTGDGEEILRDTADAREWQEATKQLLAEEARERTTQRIEEASPELSIIHESIGLFQRNADLVPGTKQFDRELASRFTQLAKPYEHRVDGKMRGYTIPVQPLVDRLRADLAASRAAAKAQPAAPAAQAPAAASATNRNAPAPVPKPPAPGPQAGIPAKAGASADQAEDFSTLFGAIGLPTLRI